MTKIGLNRLAWVDKVLENVFFILWLYRYFNFMFSRELIVLSRLLHGFLYSSPTILSKVNNVLNPKKR
ncbi:hypothetical protein ACJX0J_031239, partial [Zea mays]